VSRFNLDVSTVKTLIAGACHARVVECATAWLEAYEGASRRGADDSMALLEAAEAWDRAAAEWQRRQLPPERTRRTGPANPLQT
jgi:hypothetical protein